MIEQSPAPPHAASAELLARHPVSVAAEGERLVLTPDAAMRLSRHQRATAPELWALVTRIALGDVAQTLLRAASLLERIAIDPRIRAAVGDPALREVLDAEFQCLQSLMLLQALDGDDPRTAAIGHALSQRLQPPTERQ